MTAPTWPTEARMSDQQQPLNMRPIGQPGRAAQPLCAKSGTPLPQGAARRSVPPPASSCPSF
jgi:hypothetical protein